MENHQNNCNCGNPACSCQPLKLDYSKTDTFFECPRKYYLSHILGLTSEYGSTALRAGSTFHAGLEGFYSYIKENGWKKDGGALHRMYQFAKKEWEAESEGKLFKDDYRTLENVCTVLTAYVDHFYQDDTFLKVLHTERAFKLLIKPTIRDNINYPWLSPFFFTGKIDLEMELNGMKWLNEFKTTSYSAKTVTAGLERSPQIIGYSYASKYVYGEPPEGNMVTAVYFKASTLKSGDYGKLSIDFSRIPYIYNNSILKDWREHFISLAAQVQYAHKVNYFPPNFHSCFNYGRCQFLNICEQGGDPTYSLKHNGYKKETPWEVTDVDNDKLMEGSE